MELGLKTGTEAGAGKGTRTLDLDLGKVALYQLSYSRIADGEFYGSGQLCQLFIESFLRIGHAAYR